MVREATDELNTHIRMLAGKYDLTSIELLQILAERSALELRFMLRAERHPENPYKKADEA